MKTLMLKIKTSRPRNPFVAASLRRKAGDHRASGGALRAQAKTALRLEIERLKPSP